MERNALLIDQAHEVLGIVSERRAIKLILANKVEILSAWNDRFKYLGKDIQFPSVLKLKYRVRKPRLKVTFSRNAVMRRDNFCCQYCSAQLTLDDATVDHVVPRMMGGENSFLNCVTACHRCNNKKGGRTPEQAGMKLLQTPHIPVFTSPGYSNLSDWHSDWNFYIR